MTSLSILLAHVALCHVLAVQPMHLLAIWYMALHNNGAAILLVL